MIKAILFDCDGLMFETELISITMWKLLAEQYQVILPDDFFTRITGSGKNETEAYMNSIEGIDCVRSEVAKRRFNLEIWKNCAKDSLNKEGLIPLFTYLKENSYRIAICSSSPKVYVETLISTVSQPLQYECIVSGDMVSHAKPDPEIFLVGAEKLHVKPEECLVLEDSKMGILAAQRAGMHRCWIPDMIEADDEMQNALEYQKENLQQIIDLLEELNKENI